MLENKTAGTSLTKAANQDTSITDFRKTSRAFKILAKGAGVSDTDNLCGALMFDLDTSKRSAVDTTLMFKGIDLMLKREDQIIKREEMALQAELRKQTSKKLKARRDLMDR